MYILGFNGPPRSGKDSIGNALAEILRREQEVPTEVMSLSFPMRLAVFALAGLQYDSHIYEASKDSARDIFNGRTIREEMIELSEAHVKPRLGHDFWARALMGHVLDSTRVLIIPDIGFESEVHALASHPDVTRFLNVHIEREGYGWGNDSRSYCYGHTYTVIQNNDDVQTAARRLYGRLVNNYGWKF